MLKIATVALIALTQILDWHSTRAFLWSGRGYEKNDRIRRLIERWGVDRAMLGKGLLHVAIATPLIWLLPPLACLGAVPFLAIYARIIVNNYRIAGGKQ